MGLIILILIGSLFGWIATIALRVESGRYILRHMIAGTVGSLAVGLILSGGVFLGALRATTLLGAGLGAAVAIGIYVVVTRNKAHS